MALWGEVTQRGGASCDPVLRETMSYGSAYIQPQLAVGEDGKSPRSYRKDNREKNTKPVQYGKEFNVNLSRVELRDKSFRDSMLAYSEKMSTLSGARNSLGNGGSRRDPLCVRAKHIPKYPQRLPKKRRPMSFDELIGRDRDTNHRPYAAKQRPHSDKIKPSRDADEIRLPALSEERLKKTTKTVHVSLVSASDLYEFVDFSIKNKGTRQDSIKLMRMERESLVPNEGARLQQANNNADSRFMADVNYEKYERTTYRGGKERRCISDGDDSRVCADTVTDLYSPKDDTYTNLSKDGKLPNINNDLCLFRSRPNRVKRMKLQNPGLGVIPEDNVPTSKHPAASEEDGTERKPPCSPPPPRQLPRNVPPISILPHIDEDYGAGDGEQDETADCRDIFAVAEDARPTRRILMRDDGNVRIEVTQCPPKPEPLNAKLKAQKKIKKLIFLRDLPRN